MRLEIIHILTKGCFLNPNHLLTKRYKKQIILFAKTGYKGEILFRPPNSKKLLGLPWYLYQHDIKTIIWDVEPDTYGSSTKFFVTYTLEKTKPGSIILLHPFCGSCNSQREAISKIIDGLQTKGYRFVTVSELLTYQNKKQ